jgi:hypothetical protein
MVEFNRVLLRELCRQVEETDDPKELIELSDEIIRLINDKRRRITLAKRGVLKVIEGGKPNFNVPPLRAAKPLRLLPADREDQGRENQAAAF